MPLRLPGRRIGLKILGKFLHRSISRCKAREVQPGRNLIDSAILRGGACFSPGPGLQTKVRRSCSVCDGAHPEARSSRGFGGRFGGLIVIPRNAAWMSAFVANLNKGPSGTCVVLNFYSDSR
jgi:hypothetical protein